MGLKSQESEILMTNGGGSPAFSAVEEVVSITGPDGTAQLIDMTHLKSAGKEYRAGLPDWGRIRLECNFTGGTKQMALRTKYKTQAPAHAYEIRVPDDGGGFHQFAFNAIVMSWQISTPTNSKVTLTSELQVSGDVTYTAPI